MQARRTDPLLPGVFVRVAGALIASARRLNPSKHLESRTGRPGKNKVQVASLNTRGFNGPGGRGARGQLGWEGGSMSHGRDPMEPQAVMEARLRVCTIRCTYVHTSPILPRRARSVLYVSHVL